MSMIPWEIPRLDRTFFALILILSEIYIRRNFVEERIYELHGEAEKTDILSVKVMGEKFDTFFTQASKSHGGGYPQRA